MNSILQAKLKSFEAYSLQPDGLWHACCYDISLDSFTVVKFEPSGKQVDIVDGLDMEKVRYLWQEKAQNQ